MEYTILILLLPLASFLVLGLAGMKMRPAAAGAVGTAVLAVVALLSYWTAFEYFSAGRDAAGVFPTLIPWNAVWLPIGGALHIDLGILLDPISVMMLVVISTVSLMVHIYSLGYMKGERGFQRYYAFLSLFTMSMIGLVVATNIFQMYLFWELVGVSSYLLIGFYYTKKEAVAASKKAFIVTRFADLGFLIGILIYGYYAGTFSFTPETHALVAAGAMIPLALGLMFVGGAGLAADGFPLTLPQFTVEVRFQVSNTADRNRAVFTNGGSVLLRFEDPQNDTSDHKAHSLVQFQGDGWYLNPSLSFTPNKWQHLALTYDGTKVTLYVNGTFAGSKEGVCDPNFGSANWFGGDAGGGHGTGDSWWSGCKILMSEARIWSVCRTEAQVQNNMTTTSAKSQGLEAYWRFNEGEGNTFEDCTGNGHTLKTSKTPTWVAGIKSTDTETPWP